MRYMLGVFLGQGRNAFDLTNKGFLYVGRFEVHPLGRFESESEADLERMRRPGLAIGAAYAFHDDAPGDRSVHGYYFVGHNLKLQLDYFRVWEAAPGVAARDAARQGTDRVRLQVQLAF